MIDFLKKLWDKNKTHKYTPTRLREAMMLKDADFLKNAYRHGQNYTKRTAVIYLGKLPSVENYTFLLKEMRIVQDTQIQSYIYESILDIVIEGDIQISEQESKYLHRHIALLKNIGTIHSNKSKKKEKMPPINFRNRLRDHHEMLREMQKRMNSGRF